MKKQFFLAHLLIIALLISCKGNEQLKTSIPPLAVTPVFKATFTPNNPPTVVPKGQLKNNCLSVEANISNDMISSGVIVLQSRIIVNGRYEPDVFLLNTTTGTSTQISLPNERQESQVVSPDNKRLAFISNTINSDGQVIQKNLVIANTSGERLKIIPLEQEWDSLVGWVNNHQLIIKLIELNASESNGQKPATLLAFDPDTNEQQILSNNFPMFLDEPATLLPYWEGWSGITYNSTLTQAIYPRLIEDDLYTYGLWDLKNHNLVTSLENIFSASTIFNDNFPMPRWSSDGSQFIFRGHVPGQESFELYRVLNNGHFEQMTHLAPNGGVLETSYSWSPNDRYIALYITNKDVVYPQALVATLDMQTLNIISYCIAITYGGDGYGGDLPSKPVWSPDSKQFLVTDWRNKNNRSAILIDIDKNFATQIAENMQVAGWLAGPQ